MVGMSFILQILAMILVVGYLGNCAINLGIKAQRKQEKKNKK